MPLRSIPITETSTLLRAAVP